MTSTGCVNAPEILRMKSSMPFSQNLYSSKRRSLKFLFSTVLDSHISQTLGDFSTRLAEMEQNFSTFTARLCKSRHLQPQHQMYPARQDLGLDSNKLTAPQPLGLMAQDHLMTIGIGDADLISHQTLRMNIREVQSYYGSHANNTTKGLRSGSIIFGKNPACQPIVDLIRFIEGRIHVGQACF